MRPAVPKDVFTKHLPWSPALRSSLLLLLLHSCQITQAILRAFSRPPTFFIHLASTRPTHFSRVSLFLSLYFSLRPRYLSPCNMSLFLSRALLCLLSFFYFFFPSYSIYYNRTRLLVLTHLLHYFTVFHRRTRAPFSFLTLSLSLSFSASVALSRPTCLLLLLYALEHAGARANDSFLCPTDEIDEPRTQERARSTTWVISSSSTFLLQSGSPLYH